MADTVDRNGGYPFRLYDNGDSSFSPGFVPARKSYTLLSAASATGAAVGPIVGGTYVWTVSGLTTGVTASLQFLDLDGTTWVTAKKSDGTTDVAFTGTRGSIEVKVGQGAQVRVLIAGGTPSGINSNLAGV